MKFITRLIPFILIIYSFSSYGLTAKEIVDRSYSSQTADFEFQKMRMTLIGKNREVKETRTFVSYSERDAIGYKYIQVFLEPRGMRGTTNLTISDDVSTKRWVYLPHLNKGTIQRIGNSNRGRKKASSSSETEKSVSTSRGSSSSTGSSSAGGKIMDTDITNEDIQQLKQQDYDYEHNTRLEEKYKKRGKDLYVIEVKPSSASAKAYTNYAKRRYHIRKDKFLLERLDYYDKFNKFTKYQINKSFIKTKLGTYKPKTKLIMTVSKSNRRKILSATKLEMISSYQSDTKPKGWSSSLFSFRSILDGNLLQNGGKILDADLLQADGEVING